MLKSYFVSALRNFYRHKLFTAINVLGLAIGISTSLIIYLIVHYDFSFEAFQKNKSNVYRVISDLNFAGEAYYSSGVPFPLPEAFQRECSGIKESTAFYMYSTNVSVPFDLSKSKTFKYQDSIVFADQNYFKFFPYYSWLSGNPSKVLREPYQVVLSESRAHLYFPGVPLKQITGRQLIYSDSIRITVTGIIKDLPYATDLAYKEFVSRATIPVCGLKNNTAPDQWGSINSASQFFIRVNQGVSPKQIEKQLLELKEKYYKSNPNSKSSTIFRLQPLEDIHFNSSYGGLGGRVASKRTLYGLIVIALFILLLACINFINLSTAQAVNRAKEIGIRKTTGATKGQLIFQYLSETFLLTLFAGVISVFLTPILLHIFSDFIPKGLTFDLWGQSHMVIFLFMLLIIVSALAGLYPAWILSGYRPVWVLKNHISGVTGLSRRTLIRKTLIVSQFIIAQVFIIATLIVSKQIHFSLNRDMGYHKDAIISFSVPFDFTNTDNRRMVLYQHLQNIPELKRISLSGAAPASTMISSNTMKFFNKKEIETDVQVKQADTNYIPLFGLQLLAGRNFNEKGSEKEYIINNTYAKVLGFDRPADAIGQFFEDKGQIVGVVKDFMSGSTRDEIKPMAIENKAKGFNFHIALQGNDMQNWKSAIEKMQQEWKSLYPDEDFKYQFFDETIKQMYESEEHVSQLLKWASTIIILISSMGLLGLVIYTTSIRTKEIGVRKVLGATVTQIIGTLSKDFLMMALLAIVIAAPAAWWVMNKWLNDYAYRTHISWWIFVVSGLSMLLIVFMTLIWQTAKTAVANPVKSLRTE